MSKGPGVGGPQGAACLVWVSLGSSSIPVDTNKSTLCLQPPASQVMWAQNTPSQGVVFHVFTLLSHYHLSWYGMFKSVMKPYGKCRRFTIISDIINTFTTKWVNTCIEVVFECYVMLQPCCKTKKRQEKRTWHRPIFNDLKKKKKSPQGCSFLTKTDASAGVFLAWNWLCVGVVWRASW